LWHGLKAIFEEETAAAAETPNRAHLHLDYLPPVAVGEKQTCEEYVVVASMVSSHLL
jgi:hypothetical protein